MTEDATEAQPDVEMEAVRRGRKRTSSTWDCADKINIEVGVNTTGKCRCDADEVLATVIRVRSESTQMQECEVFRWCCRCNRLSKETVISTSMSHKAKRDKAQPRTVTPECADAMRVSEHYASTPCTRTQRFDGQQSDVIFVHVNQGHATRYPRSFMTGSREVCGQNLRQISD